MSNVNAPFGFRFLRHLQGVAPNVAMSLRRIAYGNGTAIFNGDPVTSLSTGYIAQSAAGTTQIAGIFIGCKYVSVSQKRTVWSNYWPGSDANADVEAYILDDPNAVFVAQSNGTAIALADVGDNINFAIGAGSTATGISAATLDQSTIATTSTLPFKIVGYAGGSEFAAVGPGSDPTTAYNWAYVTFNFQDFKSTTGV